MTVVTTKYCAWLRMVACFAGALLLTSCQSSGGGFVGRQEFEALTNRVQRLEATVGAIQADLPSSVSRSSSWSPPPAQTQKAVNYESTAPAAKTYNAPKASSSEKALYDQAQSLIKQKRYDQAAAILNQMLSENPSGKLAPNARYWLGETWYAQGQYSQAAREFQRVADDFPNSDKAPDALLKLAYSYDRLGDGPRAMAIMDILLTKYPQSSAAAMIKSGQSRFNGQAL